MAGFRERLSVLRGVPRDLHGLVAASGFAPVGLRLKTWFGPTASLAGSPEGSSFSGKIVE